MPFHPVLLQYRVFQTRDEALIKVLAKMIVLTLALGVGAARAEVVEGLYSAEIPVADQTQAELSRASVQALSQVLVKVSGRLDVLDNIEIRKALGESRRYVQQYAYARVIGPGLTAKFEFDDSTIAGLLSEAGAPLWTVNRPTILAWVVVETAGRRFLLNSESDPVLVAELTSQLASRGVAVRLPLFDLVDASSMTPDVVWRQDSDALKTGSARYGVEDVLAGRVAILSTGSWVGDWVYLSSEARTDRSFATTSGPEFINAGVSMVARDMASRFAVAPTDSPGMGVRMTVADVRSYADYAGVISWLDSLELIDHANVERVRGDLIELRLVAQADAEQLALIIELNNKLVPSPASQQGARLAYQWQN
ncbi:MAG: hypothetical protein ACJA09_002147 [Alcanivorax sp.]